MMISDKCLRSFLLESNQIEDLNGYSIREFDEAKKFLALDELVVDDLIHFVHASEPGAVARTKMSIPNVRVGCHRGTKSGTNVMRGLRWVINCANNRSDPYILHRRYEDIHPFTDCNGRSGRILWLWQMVKFHGYEGDAGFLMPYYFQSLSHIEGSVI